MVNEFDQSVRPEYVSNRIELPFRELAGLAANHQKEYDTNVDNAYKLKDFMSTIPEVNDPMLGLDNTKAKKAIDNEYAPMLNDLSIRIVNGNDPNAIRELTLLQRKIQNDPRIIGLKNQRAQYEAYKSDITEKAGKYDARLDDYAGTQLVDDSGNPLPFNYHGMEDSLDREKKFREAMGDFTASTKGWDIESLGEDGIKIGQKGQRSGITAEKIMEVAKSKAFTVLKQSDEGRQFEKILRRSNPGITDEQILEEATKAMFSTASNQIFTSNTSGNTIDVTSMWNTLHKEGKDAEVANLTTSSQSEALLNSPLEEFGSDMKFDSKGNLQIPGKADKVIKQGAYDEFGVFDPNAKTTVSVPGKDLNKMAEQVRMIKDIQTNHPELQGLSPKETVEIYNKARKSVSAESIPLESISNVAAKNIGQAISRNKDQRNFYVWDSKGKTEDGTLKTVLNKLDVSEEDFDKALNSGIGGYTQAGPNAGSYYVEVKDGDGNSRRVMISPDNEMKTMFKTSQMLNEARKTVQPAVIRPYESRPDIIISVNPKIKKDGSVKWEYVKAIVDQNNNILESEPTSLDEIRRDEKDVFKESNYLGTNTGVLKDNTTE